MTPAPQREEALFQATAALPASEQAAFLEQECRGQPALRARLEALLAAHACSDGFGTDSTQEAPPPGQDVSHAPDEAVGMTIGRYKLLEKVGEGGCGVVYVAEQTEPIRRRVALKVIKLGMDTKQVVARFEAERQALAMMDHPNIAKVLDAGSIGPHPQALSDAKGDKMRYGRPYFVMELVRGIRITDYCDQHQLTTRERLALFIQVCQAIQHAHQKGIIHRDIKPSNILVTLHDGVPVPKVIDFGIAKATEGRLTDSTLYTQLHQFIGTPAYMSPEQAEMSGLDIDTRSDIYSLGVLLYELLTGKTPFDGKELIAAGLDGIRRTIREKEPVRPSTRLATLSGEELTTTAKRRGAEAPKLVHLLRGDLDWIVMKCLEKDRTRRYETANGLAMDLRRHLNNEPVLARPPSATYRVRKAFRRNRFAFATGAIVLTAGVAALAISLVAGHKARVEGERALRAEQDHLMARTEAEREKNNALTNLTRARLTAYLADMRIVYESLRNGSVGRARLILDEYLPADGEKDLRDWEWFHFDALARTDNGQTLGFHAGGARQLLAAADGTFITASQTLHATFTDAEGQIQVWDGLRRRRISRQGKGMEAGPQIHVWNGRERQLQTSFDAAPDTTAIALSRSGKLLAIARGSVLEIRLLEQPSLRPLVLTNGLKQVDHLRQPRVDVMVFVQNDTCLAVGGRMTGPEAQPLSLVDIQSGARTTLAPDSPLSGVLGLALSSDGRSLAVTRQGEVAVLGLPESKTISRFKLRNAQSASHEMNPSVFAAWDQYLVTASDGGHLDLWDVQAGRHLRTLGQHGTAVVSLAASPNGEFVASAGSDDVIKLWALTGEDSPSRILRGHTDEVRGVAFLDSDWLVSCGQDQAVRLWDVRRPAIPDEQWPLPAGTIFSTLRRSVLGALNRDMRWRVWDISHFPQFPEPRLVSALSGRDVPTLPFPGTDYRLEIPHVAAELKPGWGLPAILYRGRESEIPVPGFPKIGVVGDTGVQPSTQRLYLHGLIQGKPYLLIWNIAGARTENLIPTSIANCWAMSITPDESGVVVGSETGTLEWIDCRAGTVSTWEGAFPGAVSALVLLPDNRTIFAASTIGPMKRMDWGSRSSRALTGSVGIEAMSLSPSGRRLATGDAQGGVRLWEVDSLREIALLGSHPGRVTGIIFQPDGQTLFSADANELRAWRAPRGKTHEASQ